jgi:hypothetical protein
MPVRLQQLPAVTVRCYSNAACVLTQDLARHGHIQAVIVQ